MRTGERKILFEGCFETCTNDDFPVAKTLQYI